MSYYKDVEVVGFGNKKFSNIEEYWFMNTTMKQIRDNLLLRHKSSFEMWIMLKFCEDNKDDNIFNDEDLFVL